MEKYEEVIKEFKDLIVRYLDTLNDEIKESYKLLNITKEKILKIDSFENLELYMQKIYLIESELSGDNEIFINPIDFYDYIYSEIKVALDKEGISYESFNKVLLDNYTYKTAENKKSIFYKAVYDITNKK